MLSRALPAWCAAFALAAFVLVIPQPAAAYECTKKDPKSFITIRWPKRTIDFAIREPASSQLDRNTTVDSVVRAFNAWVELDCTDITFTYQGFVDVGTSLQDVNQIVFVQNRWVQDGRAANAVALTTMTYGLGDGIIRYGVIEVNEEIFPIVDAAPGCFDQSAFDLSSVMTHEVGHFLGLAHTNVDLSFTGPEPPTMAPMVQPCDIRYRTLEVDDRTGICFVYPIGRPSRICGSLPEQNEPYIDADLFGCRAAASPHHGRGPLVKTFGVLGICGALFWARKQRAKFPGRLRLRR